MAIKNMVLNTGNKFIDVNNGLIFGITKISESVGDRSKKEITKYIGTVASLHSSAASVSITPVCESLTEAMEKVVLSLRALNYVIKRGVGD